MAISLKPEYLKRYKDIASLLWKYGRGDIVSQSGLLDSMPVEDHKEPSSAAAAPDELAHDLENMGPLYIKLGQLLSSRPDLLPIEYVRPLSRLQDQIPPFSFGEVEKIVEDELGVRLSKAFEFFDSTPLASASLGQVHRAVLRDGREVAVKVQRPNIREDIAKDLDALHDIAEFLDNHTEMGRQYRFSELLAEFRLTIVRELDYRREANNLLTIGKNIAEFNRIIVPRPVMDYTTQRVLTMDFIHGRKITKLSPLAYLSMDGHAIAEQLFLAYLKQILVDGVFHADPHPGNVFMVSPAPDDPEPEWAVALLDLGMVGHLRPALQEELLKLLLAISERRADDATAIGIKIGERFDSDSDRLSEMDLTHKVTEVLEDHFSGTIENMKIGLAVIEFTHLCAQSGVRMPVELTILGKTLLNLDEIGRTLDPKFDPNASVRKVALRLTRERVTNALTPTNILSSALEVKEFVQELPKRVNRILDAITKNELSVKVNAFEERTLVDGFQKVANRIATALVLAALIVGAAMLMRVETSFRLFGYPGLAILCFLGAAIGGCWLLIEIALHDRKMRKG